MRDNLQPPGFTRVEIIRALDRALTTVDYLSDEFESGQRTAGLGIGRITSHEEIITFLGHVSTLLQAYRTALVDMAGLDPNEPTRTLSAEPEDPRNPSAARNQVFVDGAGRQPYAEFRNLSFSSDGFVSDGRLTQGLRTARAFFERYPTESRVYMRLLNRILR